MHSVYSPRGFWKADSSSPHFRGSRECACFAQGHCNNYRADPGSLSSGSWIQGIKHPFRWSGSSVRFRQAREKRQSFKRVSGFWSQNLPGPPGSAALAFLSLLPHLWDPCPFYLSGRKGAAWQWVSPCAFQQQGRQAATPEALSLAPQCGAQGWECLSDPDGAPGPCRVGFEGVGHFFPRKFYGSFNFFTPCVLGIGSWLRDRTVPWQNIMSCSENSVEKITRVVILMFSHRLSCYRIYSVSRLTLNSSVPGSALGLDFLKLEWAQLTCHVPSVFIDVWVGACCHNRKFSWIGKIPDVSYSRVRFRRVGTNNDCLSLRLP